MEEGEKGLREREAFQSAWTVTSLYSSLYYLEWYYCLLLSPTNLIGWFNLVCHELFMQKNGVHATV
jgi:hypothetical protein